MCDCVIDGFKKVCENGDCCNKICDDCTILCNCCDNKICKSCAALCEITEDDQPCKNYLCIPLLKILKKINDKYEYKYYYDYDANPCWTGCGIKHVCIDHRYITDEDIVICRDCSDGSKYICKCGDCFEEKIYKNCEEKCQVREECTNYIKSNHMIVNNCKKCERTHRYSCIDCFVSINGEKYCIPCAKDI